MRRKGGREGEGRGKGGRIEEWWVGEETGEGGVEEWWVGEETGEGGVEEWWVGEETGEGGE